MSKGVFCMVDAYRKLSKGLCSFHSLPVQLLQTFNHWSFFYFKDILYLFCILSSRNSLLMLFPLVTVTKIYSWYSVDSGTLHYKKPKPKQTYFRGTDKKCFICVFSIYFFLNSLFKAISSHNHKVTFSPMRQQAIFQLLL